MKINKNGAVIEGMYARCAPDRKYTSFEDSDGATITIETATLLALAELVRFDAKHRGYEVLITTTPVKPKNKPKSCGECSHFSKSSICCKEGSPIYKKYTHFLIEGCGGLHFRER